MRIFKQLFERKKILSDENEIKWTYKDSLNIYAYSLDRKTLILSKMNITKTEKYNIRKCGRFQKLNF